MHRLFSQTLKFNYYVIFILCVLFFIYGALIIINHLLSCIIYLTATSFSLIGIELFDLAASFGTVFAELIYFGERFHRSLDGLSETFSLMTLHYTCCSLFNLSLYLSSFCQDSLGFLVLFLFHGIDLELKGVVAETPFFKTLYVITEVMALNVVLHHLMLGIKKTSAPKVAEEFAIAEGRNEVFIFHAITT